MTVASSPEPSRPSVCRMPQPAAEPAAGSAAAEAPLSSELAIETTALTKRFGHQHAVAGIDLAVPRGSVFGFLGPDRSGKTTSICMMLGLITPTSGSVRVFGEEMPRRLRAVLPRVGALVEGPAF